MAIRDPFHERALGCRVPDAYSFPTVCYSLKSTISIIAPAGGTVELAFLPSPCFSVISATVPAISGGFVPFAANANAGYLTTPAKIAQFMTNFRIVAWGIRVVLKDTQTLSKGRFYVAMIPAQRSGATAAFYNGSAAASVPAFAANTIGYALGTNGTAIQGFSTCQSFTVQDVLQTGSRIMSVSPSHAAQYEFRTTVDANSVNWNPTSNPLDAGGFSNVGAVNFGGYHDPVSLAGGAVILIYASGLETGNVFDIDLVYHLEGTPVVFAASANDILMTPSAQDVCTGSAVTPERELAQARNQGFSDNLRPAKDDNLSNRAYQYVQNAGKMAADVVQSRAGKAMLKGGLNMFLNKYPQYNQRNRLR